MKHGVLKFTAVFLCLLFFSCTKNTSEASFYYWKTKFSLSQSEKNVLSEFGAKVVFTRFFDVDLDKSSGKPVPVGIINGLDSLPKNINVIPVVFITNRTFLNLSKEEIELLAKNVLAKINSIKDKYAELQFDCDWSGKTKENYFLFLEEIKKQLLKETVLSCTIRLHQVKYAYKTGIPPVTSGTLMFYNMGDLKDQSETNSIYSSKNAQKYIGFIKEYQLPLDVALPIFNWCVHYRNNEVIGLRTKETTLDINDTQYFSRQENNTKFKVITDHLENGVYYKTNDLLKLESLNDEQLMEAAQLLEQHLAPANRRIIFYDLDENNIKNYDKKTLKKIMSVFN